MAAVTATPIIKYPKIAPETSFKVYCFFTIATSESTSVGNLSFLATDNSNCSL